MKEYLGVLFGVCVVAAIVKVISPDNTTKKYIEMLCSLCVLCAVVAPIIQGAVSADGLEELFGEDGFEQNVSYEKIYDLYIIEGQVSAAEDVLAAELVEMLGEQSGALIVSLDVDTTEGTPTLTGASVLIGLSALDADPDVIKAYIMERVGVECQIIYDF